MAGDLVVGGSFRLDLPGPGVLVLGQMHNEDSLFEHGGDLGGVGVMREQESVRKAAVSVLDAVVFVAVLIEFAFAGDGQRAMFQGDLHVLLLHLRQFNLEHVPAGVFGDGHQRDPLRQARVFLGPVDPGAAKETPEGVPQVFQLVQLIPTYQRIHDFS